MLGTVVNVAAIVCGGLAGVCLRHGIKDRFKEIIMQALALCVMLLGAYTAISNLLAGDSKPLLFIISLVCGGLIGEGLKIEERLASFGDKLQKLGGGGQGFSQGFIAASLLFCVGSMAILGSLDSGLKGAHDVLFAKSILDGMAALMLASTLGLGVVFSALPVLFYQGAITLLAHAVSPYMSAAMIREISIVGGVLIFGIGLNMMEIKRVKIANLLPAMAIPILYYLPFIQRLFSG